MDPLVYIVIINYNNWHDTAECLGSVFNSDYSNYKVIVIDNHSGNDSLENLEKWAKISYPFVNGNPLAIENWTSKDLDEGFELDQLPPVSFIQNESNAGFAGGNNLILKYLQHQDAFVWLLNPDMTIDSSSISNLVEFAKDYPENVVIGTLVKSYSEPEKILFYGGASIRFNSATVELITSETDIGNLDFICGGSMFLHAGAFRQLGLLPMDYFLYWEETDWCYKAKEKGYQMLVCTSAICYDKISTTIGKSFLSDYYYTRNGLLFTLKFKRSRLSLVFLSAALRLVKRIFTGQWQKAWGVYKGMLTFSNRNK